jgi:potassium efflux system protein
MVARLIYLILATWGLAASVQAAAAAGTNPQPAPTDPIALERTKVEQSTQLTDEQRKSLLATLSAAALSIQKAEQFKAETAGLQTQIDQAPKQLTKLRNEAPDRSELDTGKLSNFDVKHLKSLLDRFRNELNDARSSVAEQEKALSLYTQAAIVDGAKIADLHDRLAKLPLALPTKPVSIQGEITQLATAAQKEMLNANLTWLKLRQDNLGLLTELATVQRDHFDALAARLQKTLDQLRTALLQKQSATLKSAEQATQTAEAESPPALKPLQSGTAALLQEQNEVLAKTITAQQRLEATKRLLDDLQADRKRIQHALDVAGDSSQISTLLQKRQAGIPSTASLNQNLLDFQSSLSTAILRQFALTENLRDMKSASAYADQLLSIRLKGARTADSEALREMAEHAWSNYHNAIETLVKNYNDYAAALSSLSATTNQLLQFARQYHGFINEHLLWIPSSGLIPLTQPSLLFAGLHWLTNGPRLKQLLKDSLLSLRNHEPAIAIWALAVLTLLLTRRRALLGLDQAAEAKRRLRTDSFAVSLSALAYTIILVLPLPVLLTGAGILLGNSARAQVYSLTFAAGLQGLGQTLLFLLFLRNLCRDGGLAMVHLNWNQALCSALRRQAELLVSSVAPLSFLLSLSAAGVPSAFIHLAYTPQVSDPGVLALGRLALIMMMLLLAVAVHRIWRKTGRAMQEARAHDGTAKWVQYHGLWFVPAVTLPLGFALAAIAGYYYSAVFLLAKAGQTVCFLISLLLVRGMLLRGLYVAQRRLRFEEVLRTREEMRAKRAAQDTASTQEGEDLPIEEAKIPYGELSDQVSQLLHTGYVVGLLVGLWWIWKDVIPAFGVFDAVKLPITTSVTSNGVTQDMPLTLGDLVGGLLIGGLTLLAARSIPGLLEFTLLQRIPISRASRYAVITLAQYLVVMLGLSISFKTLGLQWSNIQWLIAALSVGLGFGLQEIVANFVSGVILLFEQPLRVGDVVAVNGTIGTVSRIHIRATTIVNWDRQELIIPNKVFITGQFINWTLSDAINRVVITVGVAYGSDTRKAMTLMREAAEEHPAILHDPAPRVTFEGFGDNSLTLVLRAYLDDLNQRLATITDLHQAINDKMQASGILIAFPQRDVHLDSARPLEVVFRHGPDKGAETSN